MNNKTKLMALIVGLMVLIVLIVQVVGIVNSGWSWEDNGWFSGDYHGLPGKEGTTATTDTQTTESTDRKEESDSTIGIGVDTGDGDTANAGDNISFDDLLDAADIDE